MRQRSQVQLMFACFYGAFALGLLSWLVYLMVSNTTPQLFYASDLSWMAAYLFLAMACSALPTAAERAYRSVGAWLVVLVVGAFLAYFLQDGEVFANVGWCSLLAVCGYRCATGLPWMRRMPQERERWRISLYGAILCLVALELLLWFFSCDWQGDTWTNPYFWIDFAITANLLWLMNAARKVVDARAD